MLFTIAGSILASGLAGNASGNGIGDRRVGSGMRASAGFEENLGQVKTSTGDDASFVRFRMVRGNTRIFLLENGIAFQFARVNAPLGSQRSAVDRGSLEEVNDTAMGDEVLRETYRMDMLLEGANENARITTEGRSDDYIQYYNHDALGVHTYSRVIYHEVYPGIDWVVYTTGKGMKYDFVVRPGSDPSKIQLRFKDHEELYVDADGQLIHGNRMGRFTEERPVSFQNGMEVDTRFVLDGDRLSFALGTYDRNQLLTIDPDRIWGTFYGGDESEWVLDCAVDGDANVYIAGATESDGAIATAGYQVSYSGHRDAFLVKFNADGTRLWGTYYGGAGQDEGYSCAVDGEGNVVLAGWTTSESGIASGGHQDMMGGYYDAFLVKFDSLGNRSWGTYYGGAGEDKAWGCAMDEDGTILLTGQTRSTDSIAFNGHQEIIGSTGILADAFLVKFTPGGTRIWGTYYGGTSSERGNGCAVNGSGSVWMAGSTSSANAIASFGHQNDYGGGVRDAFLVKFDANGSRVWGTYYGGSTGIESGNDCATDSNGNVFLVGSTGSSNAIAAGGHQNSTGGGGDAYLVKFDPDGTRLWGTYYGGPGSDLGQACAVDQADDVYVVGSSQSSSAIALGGHQNVFAGGEYFGDAFLVKFSAQGTRLWGTYYGGQGDEEAFSCATDPFGHVYIGGWTQSTEGISYVGHQALAGGGEDDGFLVKFEGSGSTGFSSDVSATPLAVRVWPDPLVGDNIVWFTCDELPEVARSIDVEICDGQGRVIDTHRFNGGMERYSIALSDALADGIYLMRFTVGERERTVRLVRYR